MFSIPVAGLAKTLLGVTISLQAAPAHQAPGHYTVRPGDTLSDIARQEYGSRAEWPALWWTNRHQIANPDAIVVGERLRLSAWHPRKAWLARAAAAAAGASAAPAAGQSPSSLPALTSSAPQPSYQASPYPAASGGVNWSAIAACESGGDWGTDTGNGFYGGLQFSEGTWLAYGGGQYAQTASGASESQQIAVAQRVLAGQGIGAWPVCGANG